MGGLGAWPAAGAATTVGMPAPGFCGGTTTTTICCSIVDISPRSVYHKKDSYENIKNEEVF
jgi:hypothetical protein